MPTFTQRRRLQKLREQIQRKGFAPTDDKLADMALADGLLIVQIYAGDEMLPFVLNDPQQAAKLVQLWTQKFYDDHHIQLQQFNELIELLIAALRQTNFVRLWLITKPNAYDPTRLIGGFQIDAGETKLTAIPKLPDAMEDLSNWVRSDLGEWLIELTAQGFLNLPLDKKSTMLADSVGYDQVALLAAPSIHRFFPTEFDGTDASMRRIAAALEENLLVQVLKIDVATGLTIQLSAANDNPPEEFMFLTFGLDTKSFWLATEILTQEATRIQNTLGEDK